jgi:Zn-dependent protease with chaperone function
VKESLGLRAAWIAAAAVGFWVLSIGMVALLAFGGMAIMTYAQDQVLGGPIALVLAGALAFGLFPGLPRKDADQSPPLAPVEHPRLRSFVQGIAADAGAPAPEVLYVSHAANAFAGSRRPRLLAKKQATVGVGLPLLATLTQNELRAVVAHEMGHHARGDVRLGPWVHRTRSAIARASDRLEGSIFWLHLPFVLYADLFMKISVRISRAQELVADALGARLAGPSAMAGALRKIEVLSAAWGAYFHGEVLPIVEQGRMPALLEGFDRYWRAAQTPGTPAFDALFAALEQGQRSRPDDTHPTLEERIDALGDPPAASDSGIAALHLLDDVAAVEERVVRDLMRDPRVPLPGVAWDQIAEEVWLPLWQSAIEPHVRSLAKLEAAHLPGVLERWQDLAEATRRGPAILSPEAERRRLAQLLGAWLTLRLASRGFRIQAPPGRAVIAERDGRTLAPFTLVLGMLRGSDGDAWSKICAESGI